MIRETTILASNLQSTHTNTSRRERYAGNNYEQNLEFGSWASSPSKRSKDLLTHLRQWSTRKCMIISEYSRFHWHLSKSDNVDDALSKFKQLHYVILCARRTEDAKWNYSSITSSQLTSSSNCIHYNPWPVLELKNDFNDNWNQSAAAEGMIFLSKRFASYSWMASDDL